jgi:hypothetical protein
MFENGSLRSPAPFSCESVAFRAVFRFKFSFPTPQKAVYGFPCRPRLRTCDIEPIHIPFDERMSSHGSPPPKLKAPPRGVLFILLSARVARTLTQKIAKRFLRKGSDSTSSPFI